MVRLFEKDARVFTTLGIGVLTEIETMKIKDELNGEYELEMTYPVTGSFYNEIQLKRLIVTKAHVHEEDDQAFRIYNITTPIDGKITINARHVSYDLSSITVEPFEATDPWEAFDKIREGLKYLSSDTRNKFTFNIVPATKPLEEAAQEAIEVAKTEDEETNETKLKVNTPSSLRSVIGGDDSLISTFGGEVVFDNFTVTYYTKDNRVGQDRGFEVRYGKNMTAFEHKKSVRNDFTAIYPFYAKKTNIEDGEQLLSYQPLYIAKGSNKQKAFTRFWLTDTEGNEGFDASRKLVSKTSPISNAIQVKTKGEYYNKLYVFISDTLLNNYGVISNGAVGQLVNEVSSYVRVFNFVKVSDAEDFKYIPNNFYYVTSGDEQEDPQKCQFAVDTNSYESSKGKEGRNYYNAVLKGTDNVLAGHYYPVPLYAYVANGSPDLTLSGPEVDIDDNVNNTNLWLSYEENGEPISRNVTNMYMMAIPMQIQNGVAKDHFVIFNPLTKKYKELKSGIEKTYATTENVNTEEVTELVTLKKFNEVTMDSEKITNGTNYYYAIDKYEVTTSPTAETWKEDTYYYEGAPIYNITKVNADTYQKDVYYKYIKENNEYQLIDNDSFPDGVIMYDKVPTYTLSTEFDETITTWYIKNSIYCSVYKWIGTLTQQEYEPEKYYYLNEGKYKRDDSDTVTASRNYYKLLVCSRVLPELHYKKYEQGKYYYPQLIDGSTDEAVMYLDESSSWSPPSTHLYCEGTEDYVETLTYYVKSEDAPLIYLTTEKDDSKVLSIDLSGSFESKPDGELLLEAANKYIEENKDDFDAIDDSFSTSFVRLSDSIDYKFIGDIEEIQNGDIVRVVFPYLNREDIPDTDKHVNLRVTSMEYDPISNTYTAIELGDRDEDLSDTVLTSGSDISSLKNDTGYVGRAEVKKLIADTIIAQNLTVEGLLSAARAELTELVSTVISTQDLNADNIVTGNLGATNVVVKSHISIEGYTLLDVQPTNQNEFDTMANAHDGYLYYKEAEYASTYIQVPSNQTRPGTDGFLYDKTYYYKNGTVFNVNNNGDVYANNVNLEGEIKATSGNIGGCTINPIPDGETIDAYTISGAETYSAGWLTLTQGSSVPLTPQTGVYYIVDYNNKTRYYEWDATNNRYNDCNVGLIVPVAEVTQLSADYIIGGTLSASSINIRNKFIVNGTTGAVTIGSVTTGGLEQSSVAAAIINGDLEGNGLEVIHGTNRVTIDSETGTLYANNVELTGKITATSGSIGEFNINNGVLKATYDDDDIYMSLMMDSSGICYTFVDEYNTLVSYLSSSFGLITPLITVDYKHRSTESQPTFGTWPLISAAVSKTTADNSVVISSLDYNYNNIPFIIPVSIVVTSNGSGYITVPSDYTIESAIVCERENNNGTTTNIMINWSNTDHQVKIRNRNTHDIVADVWIYLRYY